jgi:hypothetical protein
MLRPGSLNRPVNFLILIFIFSIFLTFSCKDSPTDPPIDNKPPGYQEDIPWPSLADSPWPMYRADPQNTGRSKWENNITGTLTQTPDAFIVEASIALGKDGSVYFNTSNKKFYCLDSVGNIRWETQTGTFTEGGPYSPVVLRDGSVLASDLYWLYKFGFDGSEIWKFQHNSGELPVINVGIDGTIYIVKEFKTLLAISGEGQLMWQYKDEAERWFRTVPAISPDGGTIYLAGNSLSAVDLKEKKLKWKTSFGTFSPLVDSKDNIYFLRGSHIDSVQLVCLNNAGELIWVFNNIDAASILSGILAMDRRGNIYFGDDKVYSVSYNGKLNWMLDHINDFRPVICDKKNNIYVVGYRTSPGFTLRSISETGNILWSIDIEDSQYQSTITGALGFDRLYLPAGNYGSLYIIK